MLRLKELRKARKLTQVDLAAAVNTTQATISAWENGKYDIDTESLRKLADILDVSVDQLLGREEKNKTGDIAADPLDNGFRTRFAALSPEEQRQVDDYVRFLLSKKETRDPFQEDEIYLK